MTPRNWAVRMGFLGGLALAGLVASPAPAAAAYGCGAAVTQSHTDYLGTSWSRVWYCNNTGGARMYLEPNRNTHVAWMDTTNSWFVCWRRGAMHEGGNDVWYYSQGDRSVSAYASHHAWGFMPAWDVSTTTDPHPEMPQCPAPPPPPPPPAPGPPKNTPMAFLSPVNNFWATAEMGYAGGDYAMMRARSNIHGSWQNFTLVDTGDGAIAIRSNSNNRYVSVEVSYIGADYGMLRARATVIASSEKFSFVDLGGGTWAIKSKANNLYVSAERDYTGNDRAMLRARSSTIGGWEKFRFVKFQTRDTSASRPVYFVHGYDGDPTHATPGYNCWDYWGDAIADFQNDEPPARSTGNLHRVGYYTLDSDCDTTILRDGRNVSNRELGRQLAWRIYYDYSQQGISVDIVAHSMGGLIVRAALTGSQQRLPDWPPFLFVEDVVTLATPHGGAAEWAFFSCGHFDNDAQCPEMQYPVGGAASPFLVWLDDNPQSDVGTDWTLVGADDDEVVPRWRALRMDAAGHLVAYTKPQPDGNGVEHTNIYQRTFGHYILKYRDWMRTDLPYNSDAGWPTLDGDWDPIRIARYAVYYSSTW